MKRNETKKKQTERKKIKIEKDKSNRRNCGPIERACLRSIDVCKSVVYIWITYLTSYWAACSRVPLSFSTILTKFWYTQSRLRFFLYAFIPSKLGWVASCLYCCTDTHAYWEEKKKYTITAAAATAVVKSSIVRFSVLRNSNNNHQNYLKNRLFSHFCRSYTNTLEHTAYIFSTYASICTYASSV